MTVREKKEIQKERERERERERDRKRETLWLIYSILKIKPIFLTF